ncbi:hypothetical protein [Dyadobacter sp. Leaf189]|uniref:hypothetical protein n=1 Tax=Dyadobacter sp. Leaf189 TaxID=1736295 RepID=UPI0006F6210B|nr:hypothetical protein [Dyadobacter sp. Leaf189]KQS32793.1 hypothetical protein ASG33_01405 [Dyadobacter sp. Leaf189]
MKKIIPCILVLGLTLGFSGIEQLQAKPVTSKMELMGKKKKYKGYKKPKSKKILGIFKRKTDCGCPNH